MADDFAGEDPLKPVLREVLDKAKTDLQELHSVLAADREVIVLPRPTEEGLDSLREVLRGPRKW